MQWSAQASGTRLFSGHQWAQISSLRLSMASDSNCQFASRKTRPIDLSFIPTDPADAAAASVRVTVPATIGSPESGRARAIRFHRCPAARRTARDRRVYVLEALLHELLRGVLRRQALIPGVNLLRLPFHFEPIAHALERESVVANPARRFTSSAPITLRRSRCCARYVANLFAALITVRSRLRKLGPAPSRWLIPTEAGPFVPCARMTPVKSPCCGPHRAGSYATFFVLKGRARVRLPTGTSSIVFGHPSSPVTTYSG